MSTAVCGEEIVPKYKISIGVGGPNVSKFNSLFKFFKNRDDFKSSGVGPFHLKFEYKLKWWFGTGLSVNFTKYEFSYSDVAYDASYNKLANVITVKNTTTSFNLRSNFYFINPRKGKKSEPYAGLGLGYNWGKLRVTSRYEGYAPTITFGSIYKIGLEATLGYRYNFNRHIAIYSEIGLSKSIVQLGITGSF